MTWIWIAFALLIAALGLRRRASSSPHAPRVDDDAIRRIMEDGTLALHDEDEPLDVEEAERAEEEFFDESWDEPEEYGR